MIVGSWLAGGVLGVRRKTGVAVGESLRGRMQLKNSILVFALAALVGSAPAVAQHVWRVAETDRPGQWTIYNRTRDAAQFGMPVELADYDGDGLDDVLLSAMNANSGPGRGRIGAGELGIALSSGAVEGVLDLATVDADSPPSNVVFVYGGDTGDLLGTETKAADIDGDGYSDIIAGVQVGDGPANTRPGGGEVAILWGGPDFGGRVYDAATPGDDFTVVYGAEAGDRLGVWVFTGDLDGDQRPDLVLGADQGDGPANDRLHAGETWVVYGGAHLRGLAEIDLADPSVPTTVVYGIDEEDHSGCTVRAGDLDGDGTDELLIGAGLNRYSATNGGHGIGGGRGPDNSRFRAGEAYAVYLGPGARPASIDLRSPPASTVIIYGADNGDAYGEELYSGDFDGDGFGDIAIGAIVGDSINNSRIDAGELALVMGGPDLPGSVIDLRTPPANVVRFYGQTDRAIAGDTAIFADVDGDGLDELVIASPNAPVGAVPRVGVTHIFFGTEQALPPVIDLADVPEEVSFLLVEGEDLNDMLAYSMAVGDADGDGLDDLVLNVMDGDGFMNRIPSSGDAHVLSGAEITLFAGRGAATPTASATPTPSAPDTPSPVATPTVEVIGCPGDCNGDGRVTIGELIRGVNQSLFPVLPLACPAFDVNGNEVVAINEVIAAVNASLQGCAL